MGIEVQNWFPDMILTVVLYTCMCMIVLIKNENRLTGCEYMRMLRTMVQDICCSVVLFFLGVSSIFDEL